MDNNIIKIATEIVRKDLSGFNEKQVKSELKIFIANNGAEDLLVDDDLTTLFEIAAIFADRNVDDVVSAINKSEDSKPPKYKRVGKTLQPNENSKDKRLVTKIAEDVCNMHLDLDYLYKDKGLGFLDAVNTVISFERLRQIEDMPNEYSGTVTLHRIKNKADLSKVVDERYLKSKQWSFLGKHNRCEGKYFTVTELLDLISTRKIITFESL